MELLAILVPDLAHLLDLASVLGVGVCLFGLGRLSAPTLIPEVQLMVGWGLSCIVLTLWGCLTPLNLLLPTAALGSVGLYGAIASLRGRREDGLWRIGVLSLPIWAVMATVAPSQVDTWLNLLPNAAYLVDHGVFPRADRPESYSFIPVAPYNTQLVAYAASALRGALIATAMGSFNILLQCAAGGILARELAGQGERIGWRDAALGLLLTMPLNPGFIPRAFFSDYGEAPIAVTVMAAVWLAARLIATAEPTQRRDLLIALALVLAALVNIKQSAIGMLLSVVVGAAFPLWTGRRYGSGWLRLMLALFPALILYVVWRRYATASFAVGELKALPLAQWNTALIPEIMAGVVRAMLQKGVYFLAILILLIGTLARRSQRDGSVAGIVLVIASVTILADHSFIIFTYIAHFEPSWAVQAHSYFRYMSQLSLVLMLGLIALLRPATSRWLVTAPRGIPRYGGILAIAAILLAPLVFLPYLRFDREAPQPQIAAMVRALKPQLTPAAPLAILVPGDLDDLAGSYLRGLVLYGKPRQAFPTLVTRQTADHGTLDTLATAGYRQALLSCSDLAPALPGMPAHALVILRYAEGVWHAAAAQTYPPGLGRRHWAGLLPKPIFCGAPS